ncbi:MAG: hypothetical protein HZA22_08965 [Nitrospirae bacterium]|nr:hypothetical protein [Nitrospirota bacterium]
MKSMRYGSAFAIALISIFLCASVGYADAGEAEGGASVVESQASATQKERKVDPGKMVLDLMKMALEERHASMVLWTPSEFWKVAFLADNKSASIAEIDEIMDALRPYTIIGVLDERKGPLGASFYSSEEKLRSMTTVVDGNGNVYLPLGDDQISPDVANLLFTSKPILARASGKAGENMHFLVFNNVTPNGDRIADPTKPGSLTVKIDDATARWRLPLNALMAPVSCPKCEEECSGAWSFCPWDGTKLPASEPL